MLYEEKAEYGMSKREYTSQAINSKAMHMHYGIVLRDMALHLTNLFLLLTSVLVSEATRGNGSRDILHGMKNAAVRNSFFSLCSVMEELIISNSCSYALLILTDNSFTAVWQRVFSFFITFYF